MTTILLSNFLMFFFLQVNFNLMTRFTSLELCDLFSFYFNGVISILYLRFKLVKLVWINLIFKKILLFAIKLLILKYCDFLISVNLVFFLI